MTKSLDLSAFPKATWDEWRARVAKDLSSETLDGIRVQPLFGPAAAPSPEFPGQPPFTRGGQANARWGMVQEYANPDLEETLEELKEDLRRDAAGAWLRFDDRLRNGLAPSEACTGGLGVSSSLELQRILEPLDLGRHAVFLDAGVGGGAMASALFEAVLALGSSTSELRGCLGLDPLADASRGARLPKAEPFANLVELSSRCSAEAPGLRASLVSTSMYHDAGASPVQELAFAVAAGTEVLRRLTEAGLSVDEASRQILFAFSVSGDLFGEIGKLRAARRLWWRVASACRVSAAAGRMVIHCRTSHRTSTVGDRGVNALRGTVETCAAAMGGADTVSTASFDEALGVPGAFGRKVAANTQLILREESFLDRVTDPAGGSWFVEEHTDRLAASAWALFQEIEEEGGFAAALQSGSIRSRIETVAARRDHLLATRQIPITGVSEYPNLQEEPYRGQRSTASVHVPIEGAGASSEEASVDSAPWPEAILVDRRDAEAFEALCLRSLRFLQETGARPEVFFANLGPPRSHRIRAGFARNLLAAGGIAAIANDGFSDPVACGEAFAASSAKAAILCGSDEIYAEMAVGVAQELRRKGADRILLAGSPGEAEDAYREAGVHGFIVQGCDALVVLEDLLQALGVAP